MSDGLPPQDAPPLTLSPEDARLLDQHLTRAQAGVSEPSPIIPGRPAQVASLLRTLDLGTRHEPAPATDLATRTLARIAAARQRERLAEQIETFRAPGLGRGLAWRQIGSIAALLLLSTALLLPVLDRNRSAAERLACASHLAQAGYGLGAYAQDHLGVMPHAPTQAGASWWNVGRTPRSSEALQQSNAAHLYLMVRSGHTRAEDLACPGNPDQPAPGEMTDQLHDWRSPQAASYSYQSQFTRQHPRLEERAQLPVLADKNPLFVVRLGRVQHDPDVPLSASSRLHRGTGQNLLWTDGSVRWSSQPRIALPSRNGLAVPDNIWTASGVTRYQGNERLQDAEDVFLIP